MKKLRLNCDASRGSNTPCPRCESFYAITTAVPDFAAIPRLPMRSNEPEFVGARSIALAREACIIKRKARLRGPLQYASCATCWCRESSAQIAAEALDALAGVLEVGGLGRVGDAERRAEAERRTLHDGDAFVLQQFGDEVLVIGDHLARRRGLADGAGAGRIDVERAFRPRAVDALGLVEHRHHEVAALLEHLVVAPG